MRKARRIIAVQQMTRHLDLLIDLRVHLGRIFPSREPILLHIFWFFLLILAGGPGGFTEVEARATVTLTAEERSWLADTPHRLVLFFNTEFPPIEFISESGNFVGMGADVIDMLERRLGVTFVKYPSHDWNEHLSALESGECAISPTIVSTPERARYAFFTDPYATVPVVIITSRALPEDLTLHGLQGHRVGVVSGYAVEKYVRDIALDSFEVISVQNVSEGLRAVSFGQLDAFVENLAVAAHHIAKEGIPNLRVAGKTDYEYAWSIGVSRKYPLLYTALQKALEDIPERELDGVRNRWIALDAKLGMHPDTLGLLKLTAIFVGLLIFSLTCITFLLKRRLNEKVAGLRESERKYRELVENANSIIIRMDGAFRITFFNEFAQEFFGFTEEEILYKPMIGTIALSTDTAGRDWTAMIDQVAKNPKAYTGSENENIRSNGERVWIAWTSKPVLDEKGKLREILCVGTDITDRKRAEEALRESEERFKTLSDKSPLGISLIDADGRYEYVNPAFLDIFGYDLSEMPTGRDWFELAYPDAEHRRLSITTWKDHLRSYPEREVRMHTDEVVCKGGERKNILFRSLGLPSGKQIVLYEDITKQRLAEDAREKLQSQLNQAQKMESVGRLAGGVAHDFNNMLGVILGHTELALMNIGTDHPLFADMKEIRKAAQRSADLTRQLLAFARKQTVAPKVLDLNETVEGMLKMLRRLIGEDISLAWQAGRNLWSVKVDPAQIDQILANLCVNARDAIAGVGKVTIETGNVVFGADDCHGRDGFVPGEYVMLVVSDDGCGMDQDTQDKLFEPFFTTKELDKGTGLGLATVYGIVKQNNGFIYVYSEKGQGTIFKVYLPRHVGKTERIQRVGQEQEVSRGHETVLLVEDESAILNMGKMMLEKLGYKVLVAGTPGEAIRLANEHAGEIHLLMTDVVMPEMNGRDLAKNIISLYPDLKRLFMSGYTANVIAHHGVLDEGVNFIQKPFSMNDLAAKLREALDGVEGKREYGGRNGKD